MTTQTSANPQPHLAGGPETYSPQTAHVDEETSREADTTQSVENRDWVQRAREMFSASKSWYDTNVRTQVERNLDNLSNRHPAGSKYHLKTYLHRSKIYRPKLRIAERDCEASVVAAVFANREIIQVRPENENDATRAADAALLSEMMKARLEQPESYWFQTVVGAVYDAWSQGVIISKQEWVNEVIMMPTGELSESGVMMRRPVQKSDRPMVVLLPIEQIFWAPGANWLNPVQSSPYLIELMPMHVVDIQAQMIATKVNGAVQPWKWYEVEQINAASKQSNDPTRRKREGRGTDSKGDNATHAVPEHELGWIHVNIERDAFGVDWIWHTIGTELLLTDPMPLMWVAPHLRPGQRPYAFGKAIIEPHKSIPAAPTELGEGLAQAANEIQNSRFDNVRLAMNRRFRVRRGAVVDLEAMRASIPGAVYETDDPAKDVVEETVQDVTRSSYEEQNVINLDLDDMTGSFSAGSVQSNRSMNETVGGMGMVRAQAGAQKEYQTRTIVLTWMYPALDQHMRMQQFYETDQNIITVAGNRAKSYRRLYRQEDGTIHIPNDDELDAMLNHDMTVRLMIGFGSGDPLTRVGNLMALIEKLGDAPGMGMRLNWDEVAKEGFSSIGFDDGDRFLHDDEDEEYASLVAHIQELEQAIETKQIENEGRVKVEQVKQAHQAALKQAELEFDRQVHEAETEQAKEEMTLQRDTLVWKMYLEEFDRQMQLVEMRAMRRQEAAQASADGETGPDGEPIAALEGPAGVMARDQYGTLPHEMG